MSACPTADQLKQFVVGSLSAFDRSAVGSHLEGCASCRHSALSLSQADAATAIWTPTEPTAGASEVPPELAEHPRYRVTCILGSGGMGTVFRGEHLLLERPVVLKVIRAQLLGDPAVAQRFEREAKLAARLSHPNVVTIYEAERLGGTQLLVMEFIDGVNLAALVSERGLLPVAESCEMLRQAALGLQHVHEQGLVHRDIKPANLIVSPSGVTKLLDLGLATIRSGAGGAGDLTADRQFLGTLDYAAPEQWESSRDVDIRADIYGLGCTLYYLLAGEAPFPRDRYSTQLKQMWAHSQAPLPPIQQLRPDVPDAVTDVLERMLAKRPEDRFAEPSEVAEALEPFVVDCNLAEFVGTSRTTTTSRLDLSKVGSSTRGSKSGSRAGLSVGQRRGTLLRRTVLLGSSALLVGLLGAAAAFFFSGRSNDKAPRRAPGPIADSAGAPAAIVPPSGLPIKVGVLHSRTGTMAISEKPVIDATLFAIDEINKSGGLLGRPVEAVVEDGQSDWNVFAAKAEKLIKEDQVCTVFGCWTSASRKTVRPVFEKYNHLLFYPVQYEGLEQSPNIVYTGAAPNQQIIPALKWCSGYLKRRRLFLVGSDYVFPRAANAIIRDHAAGLGAEVVGESYLLLGSAETQDVIKAIQESQPDVILNTINGDSNIAFFRALRAAGITSESIPTISFSVSEQELAYLGARDVAGDYAAWNYFQSIDTPKNRQFIEAFRARYGTDRTISDPMEAAYFGVHVWANAVRSANRDDTTAIRRAVRGQAFEAPEGAVEVDRETQHTSKFIRIGRINKDAHFEVVFCSDVPIDPVPFPKTRSKSEWVEFLTDLQLRWGGKWANPGR